VSCPLNEVATTDNGQPTYSFSWSASSYDGVDGVLSASCDVSSPHAFGVGTATVTCSSTDTSGNMGQCSFTVTVSDDEAPVVSCPSSIADVESDNDKTTFEFSWTATGSDNVDGSVSANCSLSSPHDFPVGTTSVLCESRDAAGNVGNCSFSVHVRDHDAPNVTACPSSVTYPAESGTSCRVVEWGSVAAVDKNDEAMTVPTPESSPSGGLTNGSSFCVGMTSVTYNFTEVVTGLWSLCTFDVTIEDVEAPEMSCPSSVVGVTDDGSDSMTYAWIANASDVVDGDVSVSCQPESPASFGVGTTSVVCSSSDAAGNSANCSFSVSVSGMYIDCILYCLYRLYCLYCLVCLCDGG